MGNSRLSGVKSRGCFSCSLTVREKEPRCLRHRGWSRSQLCRLRPRWCRERKGRGKLKCYQKAEKGFPVLELISSNRGASAMFSCQQGEIGSPCQAREDREFPPKQREFQAAAWEYSLEPPSQGRLTTVGSSCSH